MKGAVPVLIIFFAMSRGVFHNVGCTRHSSNKFGSALACTPFAKRPPITPKGKSMRQSFAGRFAKRPYSPPSTHSFDTSFLIHFFINQISLRYE